ncbi:MAG: type IX secretion system membrane protein PorP/SprF [Schleiferiaceae bacterium]|jgi:type IX secretion system PorP/SprF family membrane protein|nr:type IX secretion system membrane protein PorP/SprF [Schleiferiaceae bacterium]MDB3991814.1 type IX secretion system membrane protein PorP/SprF [Schleiferiaceae bacterium]
MRKTRLALFAMLCTSAIWAQQDVQFTQFANNKIFYNPGVIGSGDAICLSAAHRSQWVGFENAPTTQNFSANVPLDIIGGGLSVNFTNDMIGFFQDITAGVGYGYQASLAGGTLGLGVRVDFRNKNVTSGVWAPPQTMNDPSLVQLGATSMATDLSFGTYYQRDNWYAGLSSTRLLETKDILTANGGTGNAQIRGQRHYYLMGGYDIDLQNGFVLQPAMMVKTDLVTTQFDLNAAATYNNQIWGGVTYRVYDALSVMAGYQITKDLRATYSYDLTTSSLRNSSSGSHEIMMSYCFTIEIPPKEKGSYRNPIFL